VTLAAGATVDAPSRGERVSCTDGEGDAVRPGDLPSPSADEEQAGSTRTRASATHIDR
jgi:hypothetical protein